eukprot:Pgem_evm1s15815
MFELRQLGLSLVSEIDKSVTEKTSTKTSLTGKSMNTPLTTKNITSKSNYIKKRVAHNLFPFFLLVDDTNVRSATMFRFEGKVLYESKAP